MATREAVGNVEFGQRLDTSTSRPEFMVTGPSGRPIRISASAYHLLQAVRSGFCWDELALRMASPQQAAPSPADIESAYHRLMLKIDIIERQAGVSLGHGFWFRWPLIPRQQVGRWVSYLTPLFDRGVSAALLLFIGLTVTLALSRGLGKTLNGTTFCPAYILFTLSLIAHELGHATACKRFGAAPADIGFTVYWIFPAFYSDVTSAWKLRRRHRVIVDLAGAYFQVVVGGIYWLAFLLTGWQPFEIAFMMILGNCFFSLNPVFKFDGYWVLADTLGVTNLSQSPARLVSYLKACCHASSAPAALPWTPWVTIVLAVYTPLTIAFWAGFITRLAPIVFERATTYPALIGEVLSTLVTFGLPNAAQVENLTASTFLLAISVLITRQISLRLKAGYHATASMIRN